MNLETLTVLMTFYFLLLLLALWWATDTIRHHLDRTVNLIREQRNEDLRWHRDSLLSHMRLEEARKR
jgi:hypothetical protein